MTLAPLFPDSLKRILKRVVCALRTYVRNETVDKQFAPVQKGVAKVVGLILIARRNPFQVKVKLNIGDHEMGVHIIAYEEETRILWDVENHVAVTLDEE